MINALMPVVDANYGTVSLGSACLWTRQPCAWQEAGVLGVKLGGDRLMKGASEHPNASL